MQHQNAKQFRKWEKWGEIEVNSEIKVCDLGIGQKEVFRELEWSLESPHLLSDLLQQVMSELDQGRQDYILNQIRGFQVLITCCDASNTLRMESGRIFTVRGGQIARE